MSALTKADMELIKWRLEKRRAELLEQDEQRTPSMGGYDEQTGMMLMVFTDGTMREQQMPSRKTAEAALRAAGFIVAS
jgi:hypothetical protein